MTGKVPPWFARGIEADRQQRRVKVDGAEINYMTWGDPSKPALMLVHGNAAHAHWWSFIAPLLSDDYYVVAHDLSGHGESEHRPAYSLDIFARELIGVMEDAGCGDLVIIGHSFGGSVSTRAATLLGDRLSGLLLAETILSPPSSVRQGRSPSVRRERIYEDYEEIRGRFRFLPPQECANTFIVDYIFEHSVRRQGHGWVWKSDGGLWAKFERGRIDEELADLTCPLAVFFGRDSKAAREEVLDYTHQLIGHKTSLVSLPEAEHHLFLDQPLAFVSSVRAALGQWGYNPRMLNQSVPT